MTPADFASKRFSMRILMLLLKASAFFFIMVSISSARFYEVGSFQQSQLLRSVKIGHPLGPENTTVGARKYFQNCHMPTLQPTTLHDLRVKAVTHDDTTKNPNATMSDDPLIKLVTAYLDQPEYPVTTTAEDLKVKLVTHQTQFILWRTTESEGPQQDVVLLGHLMEGKRYSGQHWWNFFEGHDFDRNKMLDGCELARNLPHSRDTENAAERRSAGIKVYTDREMEQIIDPILKVYDTDNDGFIDTLEYALKIVDMNGVI